MELKANSEVLGSSKECSYTQTKVLAFISLRAKRLSSFNSIYLQKSSTPLLSILITVVLSLVGTLHLHADVVGLCLGKRSEVYANLGKVQASHLLVEVLGQAIHVDGVILTEELDLCQCLIGKRVTHHE